MKLCPTCGRKPSEANQVVAVSIPYGLLERELHGISVQPARCPDPLHDAADRVGEIVEENERLRKLVKADDVQGACDRTDTCIASGTYELRAVMRGEVVRFAEVINAILSEVPR